jgi:hypothetical protein
MKPMNDVYDAILKDIPARSTRSKLESSAGLIVELRRRGQTYREIASVLLERCGMHVSLSTLHFFVKRQAKLARKQRRSTEVPPRDADRRHRDHDDEVTPPAKLREKEREPREDQAEVLQRIAALKRLPVSPPAAPEPFQYDPTQPLRVAPGPASEKADTRRDSISNSETSRSRRP